MAFPKIEEARNLTDEELAEQILATKRQLFELRFQQATRRLEQPHQFKHLRHRLAQLITVEQERSRVAVPEVDIPAAVSETSSAGEE